MNDVASVSVEEVAITSGQLSAIITPLGAELSRLRTADGVDMQWDGDPAVWHGRAPILFPVIGMLQDGHYRYDGQRYAMPKHGFARNSRFEVVEHVADTATFRLTASADTRAIYPFEFQLDVTFRVDGPALMVAAEIVNLDRKPLPASFGFHPALRWPLPFGQPREAHRLVFPFDEADPIRRIDANGFLRPEPQPTPVVGDTLALRDDLFVDDALIFDKLESRSVRYGAPGEPGLRIDFAHFPTLGVWTKPGSGFICVEPWQGFSDPEGFTGNIRDKPGSFQVEPGESRRLTMTITLED